MPRLPALALLGLIGLGLLGGCDRPPAPALERAAADKRALFGDPSLVPTREGERVRRELAIAGELERALVELGLGPAHVDVELREPAAVIVIASLPDPTDTSSQLDELEARVAVAELSRALVPELEPERLHLWLRPAADVQPERGLASNEQGWGPRIWTRIWALMIASLGLGLSLGIVGERLRQRLR